MPSETLEGLIDDPRPKPRRIAAAYEAAIVRLVRALLLEQNDEWAVQRRYMTLGITTDANAAARMPRHLTCAADRRYCLAESL